MHAYMHAYVHAYLQVPDAKEAGLGHLCEFIEDCEFTLLSTQILYLLGVEGPSTQDPSKYIRFIYNRVVLENATVRASAVSALAKFGIQLEYLRASIVVLLQRCLFDMDDEVSGGATFLSACLLARLAHSSTHSPAHSSTCPLTRLLTHPLTRLLACSLARLGP